MFLLIGVLLVALAGDTVVLNRLGKTGEASPSVAATSVTGSGGCDSSETAGPQAQRSMSAPAVVPRAEGDPSLSRGYGS